MMGSNSSVVTRKGQITIPADIRKELNIKEGDRMIFVRQNGSVQMLTPEEIVRRTSGSLRLPEGRQLLSIEEEKEAVAQAIADEVAEGMTGRRP
ncbi:MAG: AbrB/MazE/SpoVT family DNA-binding domain-containing protein [Thermomicrobiales bacterium]|nr:AbrB/MazE/SpoVT family DNA-binding domain-containing protein [Thermomicrobiales bacterium]